MMFSFPTEEWLADDDICNALDTLLILHADHEQNCSTSAVRWWGPGMRRCTPASLQGSARCGALVMAAPIRRCW